MQQYGAAERFHLIFLGHLSKRVAPELFALKGGCNLRFYFKSTRYSEDLSSKISLRDATERLFEVRKIVTGHQGFKPGSKSAYHSGFSEQRNEYTFSTYYYSSTVRFAHYSLVPRFAPQIDP